MTYAQGGLIQASDYNSLVGTDQGTSSVANKLNTVWGVGQGAFGYGQTPVTNVTATSVVTATQWASLINTLNNVRRHQSGSATNLTANTAGQRIDYLSSLSSQISTAYSNALNVGVSGTTVTGSAVVTNWSASIGNPGGNPPNSYTNQTALTNTFGLTAKFASPDQARYFFNAGGKLKYNISAAQNSSTSARTNEIISLLGFLGGVTTFGANTNSGRIGSGGTVNGSIDTNKGYWTVNPTFPSSWTTLVNITSTVSNYTGDNAYIQYRTGGYSRNYPSDATNNPPAVGFYDNGNLVSFMTTITSNSGTDGSGGAYPTHYGFDDSFNVNVTQSIDVTYPETTNLSNTWGAVIITNSVNAPWN